MMSEKALLFKDAFLRAVCAVGCIPVCPGKNTRLVIIFPDAEITGFPVTLAAGALVVLLRFVKPGVRLAGFASGLVLMRTAVYRTIIIGTYGQSTNAAVHVIHFFLGHFMYIHRAHIQDLLSDPNHLLLLQALITTALFDTFFREGWQRLKQKNPIKSYQSYQNPITFAIAQISKTPLQFFLLIQTVEVSRSNKSL